MLSLTLKKVFDIIKNTIYSLQYTPVLILLLTFYSI